MSWHNDFEPECESGHESTTMRDDGPVHYGQSRTYVCPACGREVLASNVPGEAEPSTRQLRAGTTDTAAGRVGTTDTAAGRVGTRGNGGGA